MIFTAGCITPPLNLNDPQEIKSKVRVEYDEFKKVTKYKGPDCIAGLSDALFIRAYKKDISADLKCQIYVKHSYGDYHWHFYDSAYDSDGNRIDVTLISRDLDGCSTAKCSYTEHIALNVSKEYLETHKDTGIRFKICGRGGEQVVFLNDTYVTAFLSVVNF